ncbi:S-methyl-5'-thioadenosine phosphorylase [Aquisphaera giovannonii]|uniref:S-methyl-5'-thioadenosine phosphorylase n=1 Tax=Aquisphaera giovannonii TaxID=406548 RepID=A0A5B9VX04_9BACT|nr:MTAP family purine nucleoside phosphorylase [Aquisphaera giovannonii]QEH32401.1 S-methyl-5'-thioadenosine phosphorylase [Aquisphaera giovannonii]
MVEKPLSVGVIGGGALATQWGLPSELLDVETPHGEPSSRISKIAIGEQVSVFAILRHGEQHARGAEINHRANVEALRRLGCDLVISVSLAGAISGRFDTGMTVIYDDVLDFRRSTQSFFGPRDACHVSMSPMVCPPLAAQLSRVAAGLELPYGGTMVVMEGPRFSTRAESKMYAAVGGELICQTIAPECFLVRERGMCWAGVCLVTDRDTRDPAHPVSTPLIFANLDRFRARNARNLLGILSGLRPYDCPCRSAEHAVPKDLTEGLGPRRPPSREGDDS